MGTGGRFAVRTRDRLAAAETLPALCSGPFHALRGGPHGCPGCGPAGGPALPAGPGVGRELLPALADCSHLPRRVGVANCARNLFADMPDGSCRYISNSCLSSGVLERLSGDPLLIRHMEPRICSPVLAPALPPEGRAPGRTKAPGPPPPLTALPSGLVTVTQERTRNESSVLG